MKQLRWNTNSEALQPNHEAAPGEAGHLSADISLAISSLSPSISFLLSIPVSGMGKLPMNETTVDTKRIIFLPLLHCTGSGLWNPVIQPQSSGLSKH